MICHNGFIYFVGGNTQSVEKYEISSQKFTKLCPINAPERKFPILYVNNNFLYAFFGMEGNNYIESIERVNLKNPKSKWEMVMYKPQNLDLKMIGCGIVPLTDNQILLCGGKSADKVRKCCLRYDFQSFTFTPWEEAPFADGVYFGESLLVDLEEGNFGHFNLNKNENFFKVSLN